MERMFVDREPMREGGGEEEEVGKCMFALSVWMRACVPHVRAKRERKKDGGQRERERE